MAKQAPVAKSEQVVLLELLKVELTGAIEDARTPGLHGATQPAAVAALSKELRAVQSELAALGQVGKVSVADEIAARTAARVSGATDSPSSARRGQSRRGDGVYRTG